MHLLMHQDVMAAGHAPFYGVCLPSACNKYGLFRNSTRWWGVLCNMYLYVAGALSQQIMAPAKTWNADMSQKAKTWNADMSHSIIRYFHKTWWWRYNHKTWAAAPYWCFHCLPRLSSSVRNEEGKSVSNAQRWWMICWDEHVILRGLWTAYQIMMW